MSAISQPAARYEYEPLPRNLPRPDHENGTLGMWLFISTEAMLFVMLFFSYFLLARGGARWLQEKPPKLTFALVMLGVLLSSSFVLHWGERNARRGRIGTTRAVIWATCALGVGFLILQFFEYRDHLRTLQPTTDAYGSIFYTITSVHGLHVILGLLMLAYVACLPRVEEDAGRWRVSLHNVGLYWHFVDTVWVLIVSLLYVLPNLR